MNVVIILAGGVGSRLGADIPKQFIEVMDKPILLHTIDIFEKHTEIDAIEVVTISSYKNLVKNLIIEHSYNKVKWITEGGGDFQESVIEGLVNLEDKIDRNDIVLIHFGVSPFVTDEIISDTIRVCKEKGNAVSATDFFLSSGIKDIRASVDEEENSSSKYIDRETIVCMNAPYAFEYGMILDTYKEAISKGIIKDIDPYTTTLLHTMGKRIYFSKGSQINIKITKKEDIDLFRGYLMMKKEQEKEDIIAVELEKILKSILIGVCNIETKEDLFELGLDSMGVMAVVSKIEENYRITIDPEDIIADNFENIECIEKLINKYRL